MKNLGRTLVLSSLAGAVIFQAPAMAEMTTESAALPAEFSMDDYLIADAGNYISYDDLSDISVTATDYVVGDEDIEQQVSSQLYQNATYEVVDSPATYGYAVSLDMTATLEDGTADTQEDLEIELGMGQYGDEFDSNLLDAAAGDTRQFTVTYGDEDGTDYDGHTVTFDVTVNEVAEFVIPELTDDYARENLDADSADAYRESIRESMESYYENANAQSAATAALDAALDYTMLGDYPQELYDTSLDQMKAEYAAMAEDWGLSEEDFYDQMDIDEDTMMDDALSSLERQLFISAVIEDNDVAVSQDDYTSFINDLSSVYGYEDGASLEAEAGRGNLVWTYLEYTAGNYILSVADVTRETETYDSYYELEDESEYIDFEDLELEEGSTENGFYFDFETEA